MRHAIVGGNFTPIGEYSSTAKNRQKWVELHIVTRCRHRVNEKKWLLFRCRRSTRMVAAHANLLHKNRCSIDTAALEARTLHRLAALEEWLLHRYCCSTGMIAAQVQLLHRNGCCTGTTAPQEWLLRRYSCSTGQVALKDWLLHKGTCMYSARTVAGRCVHILATVTGQVLHEIFRYMIYLHLG